MTDDRQGEAGPHEVEGPVPGVMRDCLPALQGLRSGFVQALPGGENQTGGGTT